MRKITLGLLALACLATASVATAQEYWPIGDAVVYHYETDSGAMLDVTFHAGVREALYCVPDTCWTWEQFGVDAEGDILLSSNMNYCAGAIDPDYMWSFSPPVKFLDLPLSVGQTWSTLTVASGYGVFPSLFAFEVVASQTVDVPLGSFEVMVVEETATVGDHGGTYYLHRQLGPVILPGGYKLVRADGIVGAETSTWGGVKALFR